MITPNPMNILHKLHLKVKVYSSTKLLAGMGTIFVGFCFFFLMAPFKSRDSIYIWNVFFTPHFYYGKF